MRQQSVGGWSTAIVRVIECRSESHSRATVPGTLPRMGIFPCTAPSALVEPPAAFQIAGSDLPPALTPVRPSPAEVLFKRGARRPPSAPWPACARPTWWHWPWPVPCCSACAPPAVSCSAAAAAAVLRPLSSWRGACRAAAAALPSPTLHRLDGPQPDRSVHRADAGAVQLVRLGVDGRAHGAAAAEPAPRRHAQRHGRL